MAIRICSFTILKDAEYKVEAQVRLLTILTDSLDPFKSLKQFRLFPQRRRRRGGGSTGFQEIIRRCATQEFTLVTSEVITEELSKIPDINKRLRVEKIVSIAQEHILIDDGIISRMYEFVAKGGDAMDSLHVACVERAGAVFLTTDDDLITFFKLHQNCRVPDDAIRFLHIYEPGSGDWTKDRKKYLENDPDKIIKRIMERRKTVPVP